MGILVGSLLLWGFLLFGRLEAGVAIICGVAGSLQVVEFALALCKGCATLNSTLSGGGYTCCGVFTLEWRSGYTFVV